MDYRCVKACPILFLALLGKTYIQLDIVVPMAAQVVIRQIGCALLYSFQAGKIGLAQHGIVQLEDQGVIAHGMNPVIGEQGHILFRGCDDQGVHLHQPQKAGGDHAGNITQTLGIKAAKDKFHAAGLHFGITVAGKLGQREAFADDREHGINHLPASGRQRFRPALCSRNTPSSRQP